MTKALKWLELMLPAHVRPVKQYSRTAVNGSKDNTSRLKWLLRGLHSVFGTQLDHPSGPLICFTDTVYAHKHTYSKAHTLSPVYPTWRPFVICSLSALFAWIIWKLHLLMPF